MSSPPLTPAYVPYQAYKSKRHSRNISSSNTLLTPNQSPPPLSRPPTSPDAHRPPPRLSLNGDNVVEPTLPASPTLNKAQAVEHISVPALSLTPAMDPGPQSAVEPPPPIAPETVPVRPKPQALDLDRPSSSSQATLTKKPTSFRRLQPKSPRASQANVHSRTNSSSSSIAAVPDRKPTPIVEPANSPTPSTPVHVPTKLSNEISLLLSPHAIAPPQASPSIEQRISQSSQQSSAPPNPSTDIISVQHSLSTATSVNDTESSLSLRSPQVSATSSAPSRKPAPYRPGFQPKGVYRPLTDEFLALRRSIHDGEGETGIKRVERTKLERRLEKLISLHFPDQHELLRSKETTESSIRPSLSVSGRNKHRNSLFGSFRNLSIQDAGDIWREVVSNGLGDQSKAEVRATEQRITPWQEDSTAIKCPLCSAAFHPLTNLKNPQRPVPCSILFVVDAKTRQIEEVGEGVDYGVKKRGTDDGTGRQGKQEQEDKFLKGVRICRQCRPVLLRQQYYQQAHSVPSYVHLYEDFINLESEIEESLPKFQELLMSLSHHDQPTKEASAARKRLLESFAQYDRLSKKIRALPCTNGPGSSQDRVQAAILTRANLFLQKNMFPLQSLPTPQTRSKDPNVSKNPGKVDAAETMSDLDSALARTLQPLLEQEALLESFVEEAQMQRKFEDVKTLKVNLAEIRLEIERLLSEGSRP
ncbi:hypothetical protein D9613_002945 [Agrocybe pediades]|uniref:Rabenosyn Rab binding domain-containing protein n=1 Tax=Agrocybe pediades TaxID=84607 RepID=A0A8H4QQM8_9AGAR|nr:hypothetical protein D9613_002945 [Agrocybe pediades]